MNTFKQKLILALVVFNLSGCGFHLSGTDNIPTWFNDISLLNNDHYELKSLIKAHLIAHHIKLNEDINAASYSLYIAQENFQQQAISISSTASQRQYQLLYIVHFNLLSKRNKKTIQLKPIVVTRLITMNSNQILGSTEEEDMIKQEMRFEVIRQLFNTLQKIN
ncbi:MAG: LPS assembly lipoprotein LptE [Legionella sp.]